MDNPTQNRGELRQALLDKWAEIRVECLQRFVASMPRRLVAIIAARSGIVRYWTGIHKTRPTGSIMQKKKSSLFDQICHYYHPMTLRYAHAAYFSNIDKCHHKFTKIHIKENSAYNTQQKHKFCQRVCRYTSQADRIWIISKKVPHSRM